MKLKKNLLESMNTSQTGLVNLNYSISRSGQVRTTKQSSDTSTQTTDVSPTCPKLRINSKISTDEIKKYVCSDINQMQSISRNC